MNETLNGQVPSRVLCTRERTGRLEYLLARAGALPVHLPLICVLDLDDDTELRSALEHLGDYGWLVVTSQHGSDRVGPAAAAHPDLQLAAVGRTTAARLSTLAGRPIDFIPTRQNAAELVAEFPAPGPQRRVLVAQADRADDALAIGLAERGFDVDRIVAYRTALRTPTDDERRVVSDAAAVAFASGSAAQAWAAIFGTSTPAIVAAIGPTTAEVATRSGLEVTHVAADHSIDGLANTVIAALAETGDRSP